MKDFTSRWNRLAGAARQAPAREEAAVPFGFSTRVAALALSAPAPVPWLAAIRQLSFRALWLAGVIMLGSMAANYAALASNEDDEQSIADPVSEVFNTL